MRKLLFSALTVSLCCSSALAQETARYDSVIRAARTTSWNAITKGQGSGVSVAIMDKGKLVYSEGMGVRERALNNRVDSHTRFNIGSTSKMFPVVAILLLVDDGKVSLDEPVVRYIPDFRMKDERYKDITVRMLLNHSSGLPGSTFVMSFAPEGDAHQVLLETLARDHLKHVPGADSMYCNDGFTLAEILVERVSGQKFMDFLEQRVFQPLGMRDTGLSVGELPPETNRAEAYEKKTARKYPAEVVQVHGAGGLSSTPEDLCRFGNSFTPYGKKILSDSSLQELRTARKTPFGKQLRNRPPFYSMGWDFSELSPYDRDGLPVIAKGGNTMFYSANLEIAPDQGLVIALLISGNASGESLTRPILVELLDQAGLARKESLPAARPPVGQIIPAEFRGYEGYYVGEGPGAVQIRLSKDRMNLNVVPLKAKGNKPGEPAQPLYSLSYSNGLLYEVKTKAALYLAKIDDTACLVTTPRRGNTDFPTVYGVDAMVFQKLKKIQRPLTLFQAEVRPWLVRNLPASAIVTPMELVVTPQTYAGLDGYVDFVGLKKVESLNYASVAATHFRDQTELELWKDQGTRWARVSNFLYSYAAPAQARAGENSVLIGPKGYNEWLELQQDAIVTVGKPVGGRVLVLDSGHEKLFDSILDSDDVFAPKGSLVFCAGPVASRFAVTLK